MTGTGRRTARLDMTSATGLGRRFTAWTAGGVAARVMVATVVGVFVAEGMPGCFYGASMFCEGMDCIWLIYGGRAAAVAGATLAICSYLLRQNLERRRGMRHPSPFDRASERRVPDSKSSSSCVRRLSSVITRSRKNRERALAFSAQGRSQRLDPSRRGSDLGRAWTSFSAFKAWGGSRPCRNPLAFLKESPRLTS